MIATAMMDNPTMHRSHHEMIRCSWSTRSLWCSCTDGRESLGTEVEVGVAEGAEVGLRGADANEWMDAESAALLMLMDGRRWCKGLRWRQQLREGAWLTARISSLSLFTSLQITWIARGPPDPPTTDTWDQQQYLWFWIGRKQIWPQGWSGGVAINIFRTRPLHMCWFVPCGSHIVIWYNIWKLCYLVNILFLEIIWFSFLTLKTSINKISTERASN